MFPSITIFNKVISMYNIMTILGILCAGFYIIEVCKKRKIDDTKIITMLVLSFLGMFIGGHLLYGITQIKLIKIFILNLDKIKNFKHLIDCLFEIFGGSVFYGGLLGGMLVSYVYAKKSKMNVQEVFNLVIPVVPLFHFFGRIGCFLVGCCYGVESNIGFTYTHSLVPMADNVCRFPIQLVEALFNLILFIVLAVFSHKKIMKNQLVYIYFIAYPVARFIFEFFRGDMYRGFLFGLSTSQIISIILFVITIILIIRKKISKDKASSK